MLSKFPSDVNGMHVDRFRDLEERELLLEMFFQEVSRPKQPDRRFPIAHGASSRNLPEHFERQSLDDDRRHAVGKAIFTVKPEKELGQETPARIQRAERRFEILPKTV